MVAAGLGIALVLLLLQFPAEQRAAGVPQPAAKPAALAAVATRPAESKADAPQREPRPRPLAALSRQTEVVNAPPPETPAAADEPVAASELVPALAASPAPAEPPQVTAQPGKPDSVFEWGPWAGESPSSGSDAQTPHAGGGALSSGVLPGVNVAVTSAGTAAAGGGGGGGGIPPPPAATNTRPGFGWGDRNHTHIPRKHR